MKDAGDSLQVSGCFFIEMGAGLFEIACFPVYVYTTHESFLASGKGSLAEHLSERNWKMPIARTNQEWIRTLSSQTNHQTEAVIELRNLLYRTALYTLVNHL